MTPLVARGATLAFEPDPGWTWKGWNGELALDRADGPFTSEGAGIALLPDIMSLAPKLIGKMYTASGFDAIPGNVVSAIIVVDEGTLSSTVKVSGMKCVTAQTKGTFSLSCVPSFGSGSPPPPDPNPAKKGKWQIVDAGQSSVNEVS